MLKYNNENIIAILAKGRVIEAVYHGADLIWEAVLSCFGGGMWVSKKPWIKKEGWRLSKRN